MERKLNGLFDFQRFQNNARLACVIGDVVGRYARELADDELVEVSAAGSTYGDGDSHVRPINMLVLPDTESDGL